MAGLRRRRLQGFVIGCVLLLATSAATLAFSILVESEAPYQRAFEAANGAHLVIDYAGSTDPASLAATTSTTPVTAATGPWPVGAAGVVVTNPDGGKGIAFVGQTSISGRADPNGPVDQIGLASGRWWQQPGEVVLETAPVFKGVQLGDTVTFQQAPPAGKEAGPPVPQPVGSGSGTGSEPVLATVKLTVVGFANGSISTPDVRAWMSPADVTTLAPTGSTPDLQMLYRVAPSATSDDLAKATSLITAGVAPADVHGTMPYLTEQANVNRLADLMVPILLAFSLFALLAAAFAIVNIVSGVVLGSYREIGLLKSVGFTPRQVSGVLLAEILVPVVVGSVAGVVIGVLASQPTVANTARAFGLPSSFQLSLPVIGLVLGLAFATAILAAIGPAWRAGRLSAVSAMTRGAAPSLAASGGGLRRRVLGLPFRDPVRLGLARSAARPLRTAMTVGALVVGVGALAFSLTLAAALRQVGQDIDRDVAAPVRVELFGDTDPASVAAAIHAQPGTAGVTGIAEADIAVAGLGANVPYVAYDGDSSFTGYALIDGRWFNAPGEVVAPTNFLHESGLHVGDRFDATVNGQTLHLALVGEIFDQAREARDDVLVRGTFATLASAVPDLQVNRWEVSVTPATSPTQYVSDLRDALGPTVDVQRQQSSDTDEGFLLFEGVVAILGIVLVAISIGGVFNTVLLDARERVRETAILKAIGMAPRQIGVLVASAVVPLGVIAAVIGVPLGIALERVVLGTMAEQAAHTGLSPDILAISPVVLLVAACSGVVIGLVGALLPARRAARSAIAPVLQAE
jgi:putative ABC transport system permease protein